MMTRVIVLTLEYNCEDKQSLWTIGNNIRRILEEDMPYVRIINIRIINIGNEPKVEL
jgi:hypothetical protein